MVKPHDLFKDTFNYDLYHEDAKRFKSDFERHKESLNRSRSETNYFDLSRSDNLVDVIEPFASDAYFPSDKHHLSLEYHADGGRGPSALLYRSHLGTFRASFAKCGGGSTLEEKILACSRRIYERVEPSLVKRISRRLPFLHF